MEMHGRTKEPLGRVPYQLRHNRRWRPWLETGLLYGLAILGAGSGLRSLFSGWPAALKPSLAESTVADIYPDTDFPLRPAHEPWDISSSYPYPHRLSKEVSEGTWLRIATHPHLSEIVFDMLGDLYCMSTLTSEVGPTQARPFLQGVPFDKEPTFSSNGSLLVFTSDAGFGVDNIWTLPYTTCEQMAASSSGAVRESAVQQTNSTFRFFSSPAFHPTEPKLIATKWYLTGRPNGAGEIWEFPLLLEPPTRLDERGGKRVIGRNLPASWPSERYIQSQLGAEQARFVGHDGDGIIFTRNVRDNAEGIFSHNKDVHLGINAVFLYNSTTGITTQLVDAFPGGANMPRLSHDGRTLAYVKRVKEKEVLVLKDMHSGTVHYAWDGLTYDVSVIPAFMGAYPNYGFSPNDESIIIWSQGQIYKISLGFNVLHERIRASAPELLPFKAQIDLALGSTRYTETDIRSFDLRDEGRVHVLRGLRSNYNGDHVTFEAAGDTYMLEVATQKLSPLPKVVPTAQYYHPSFILGTSYILHARWDQRNLTSFEVVNPLTGKSWSVQGVPKGRYLTPVIRAGRIAFVRTGKDLMLGDVEETTGEGVWLGDITLPGCGNSTAVHSTVVVNNLRLIDHRASQDLKLDFKSTSSSTFLLVQGGDSITQYNVDGGPGRIVATGKTSTEMTASGVVETDTKGFWSRILHPRSQEVMLAFRDFQNTWISKLEAPASRGIWSKPRDKQTPKGLMRLSRDGGHDVTFSDDGKTVFWFFGPHLYHASIPIISHQCAHADVTERDSGACVASLVYSQEIIATYETDLSKMKRESKNRAVALVNATIIPMDNSSTTVIHGAAIILQNGVIVDVGVEGQVTIPQNAHVIDVGGGAILPGFVDVHGHWASFLTPYPFTSWEHETFLGYGVTTLHNPSSRTLAGPWERALVEKGAFYGGRLFNVGEVLYGSTQPSVYTEVNSLADARAALLRQKIEGGESSFSVKNYQLSRRSARQRLLLEAEKLGMLIVPEGGWSLDWDLTYFIDGMTTLEHPVPIPELYDDVLSLIAASGSSYTQVAVMNYGGLFGQNWVHQVYDIPNDPKLRKYVKHDVLEKLSEVVQAPDYDYQFFNTTISAKKLKDRGVRTNIGAHGEQPIGFLYHSEMLMNQLGGQTALEILRAATIEGATSLGLQSAIGSLEPGKLADLVVYPPGVDSVDKVWGQSKHMRFVMRGGRLFEVEDGLVEVWPRKGRRQDKGRINPEDE